MISDNVADLFTRDTGPALRFRQGTVVAWNASTGENTIDVGGGTLDDLPILNTGEAIALKPGHVVGLLVFGQQVFVLGRITTPGDPNFAAASVEFGSAGAQVFGYATSTAMVNKATSAELVVPDWADEALVMVTGFAALVNNSAATTFGALQVGCNGGVGGAAPQDIPVSSIANLAASSRNQFTGLSGGEILTVAGAIQSGVALLAHASNAMFVHAIAVYKSNV